MSSSCILGISLLGRKSFLLPFKVLLASLRMKLTWTINDTLIIKIDMERLTGGKKQSFIMHVGRPSNETET